MLMPVGRPVSAIAAGYLALFAILPLIGLLPAIAAIICGVVALRRIRQDPSLVGKGRAWFGIIFSSLTILATVVFIIVVVVTDMQRARPLERLKDVHGRRHPHRPERRSADDRFARFRLIGWWDQERLAAARVLVIGAGALGNEIIKNLALLGVGRVFVADRDRIELSNLSRSVLFREVGLRSRQGRGRCRAGPRALPRRSRVHGCDGNIVYDLGLGVYRWADVIIGGLDNREARVAINQAAAKVGKPWIDGAIERLDGVARVFDPATGPCYECTMSDVDWKMLEARRSCALLSRDEMEQGKVPTTPTTSSVIAGIQVQEAVKMLHGLDTLSGQGFVFDGTAHQSYIVTYSRLDDCPSHDAIEPIDELRGASATSRPANCSTACEPISDAAAVVEFNHDLLSSLTCAACDRNVSAAAHRSAK